MSVPEPEHGVDRCSTLASRLTALAHRFGCHALLTTEQGEILCHAIGPSDPPRELFDAILCRSVDPAESGRRRPRTLGVLPGGVVIRWEHEAFPRGFVSVPLADPVGQERRHLLLLDPAPFDIASLADVAAVLATSLPAARSADDEAVRAALDGSGSLPSWMTRDATQVRVLTVRGSGPPHLLQWALASAVPSTLGSVRDGDHVDVVMRDSGDALREAQSAVEAAAAVLGSGITGALSDSGSATAPLRRLREQAHLAAAVLPLDGTCVLAHDVRARATLGVLQEQLAGFDVWQDPTQALLEGPLGEQLGLSVLAWLEANGDTSSAARATGMHPNTLRYRLKRAEKVIGSTLDDPDVRLELHLRLRQRLARETAVLAVRTLEVVS